MPNLVLGLVENVDRKYVEPFVTSLRLSGYEDEIVLFGNNVSKDAKDFLDYHQVRLIQYAAIRSPKIAVLFLMRIFVRMFRAYDRLSFGKAFPLRDAIIKLFWNCSIARFYLYDDLLFKTPKKYEKILICDVRDTIFQRCPFLDEMKFDVYCFEEYPGIKISQQPHNRAWILQLFGEDILTELSHRSIICSGIILGTHDGMGRLFGAMKSIFWKCEGLFGYDQGALNFLMYKDRIANIKVASFGESPVMHIGIAPENKIITGKNGEVLCNDGSVCPVVHQYDRHPGIQISLLKAYGSL